MDIKARYSLAAIVAILIYSSLIAGMIATISTWVVIILLGAPGFAVFGYRGPLSNPERYAVTLLAGLAITMVGIASLGSLLNHYSIIFALTISLAFAALISYIRNLGQKKGGLLTKFSNINSQEPALPDILFLWLTVVIVLAVISLPLSGVGTMTDRGETYRPFFCADLFKNLGIANAFLSGQTPPIDPFGATGPLHYYWLQNILPATVLATGLPFDRPMDVILSIGIFQTLLLVVLLYGVARRLSGYGSSAFIAVLLGILSLSLDGLTAQLSSLTYGWLEIMKTVHLDPLDFTRGHGAQYRFWASNFYRILLYHPQHLLSTCFFLAYVLIDKDYGQEKHSPFLPKFALLVALLPTSILIGIPLLGIVLALSVIKFLLDRSFDVVHVFLAIALGMVLLFATGMLETSSASRVINGEIWIKSEPELLHRLTWLPAQWITSFGPLAILCLYGFWWLWRKSNDRWAAYLLSAMLLVSIGGYVAAEGFLPLGRLREETELKLSFVAGMTNMLGASVFFGLLMKKTQYQRSAKLILFGLIPFGFFGMLTPIHDMIWHSCPKYNCDNANGHAINIPMADIRAMDWVHKHTPLNARFQQLPEPGYLAGGRDVWVPVFAGRVVLASQRGTNTTPWLLSQVRSLFDPNDNVEVGKLANSLEIDYLYLSRSIDPVSYDQNYLRFSRQPELVKVYSNNGVSVWKVLSQGVNN